MRRYTLDIRGKAYVIDVQELAADSFEVVVDDETYRVTLTGNEDVTDAAITPELAPLRTVAVPAARPPEAAPAAATPSPMAAAGGATRPGRKAYVPSPTPSPRKSAASGTASINAPMPGVVIEIDVKAGDTVARGQQVAILDAMKMHNSIRSPRDGTIREVCVDAGQAVGHGDPILRFEEG
jgi:biotin carboxyl carrier protein